MTKKIKLDKVQQLMDRKIVFLETFWWMQGRKQKMKVAHV